MRKENYMIAMFNKELLTLSPPLPFLRNRTVLTRILEWSLGFCIIGFVFDERGQVRKRFLKDMRRAELVEGYVSSSPCQVPRCQRVIGKSILSTWMIVSAWFVGLGGASSSWALPPFCSHRLSLST